MLELICGFLGEVLVAVGDIELIGEALGEFVSSIMDEIGCVS